MSADMREKLLIAALGFLLTGVLGAMATTWIQQRGWTWQNRVAKIDKDTQNALSTYQSASDLANARWHAMFRVVQALEHGVDADEWQAAREEFAAVEKDWAIKFTGAARDVDFYVDTPFAIDARDRLKLVWPLPCDGYAIGKQIDATSARLVLEVVNHCAGLLKDQIDKATNYLAKDRPKLEGPDLKAFTDLAYKRLDALYRTNETLRCVIFGRALEMRGALDVGSFWGSFFGLEPPSYKAPDVKNCIG
jgi:hypothetical protein